MLPQLARTSCGKIRERARWLVSRVADAAGLGRCGGTKMDIASVQIALTKPLSKYLPQLTLWAAFHCESTVSNSQRCCSPAHRKHTGANRSHTSCVDAAIGCAYGPHLTMAEFTKHSEHRDVDLVAAQFDAFDSDTQAGSAGGDSRARRHRRLTEVLSATSAIVRLPRVSTARAASALNWSVYRFRFLFTVESARGSNPLPRCQLNRTTSTLRGGARPNFVKRDD
jgi:hypothetical protein